jgi:transcriptional regulator with XRE-family HTH domain
MSYLFKSDQEILLSFGKRFQQSRISANISQERLAVLTGVSRTTISRLEKGDNISVINLITLLREIGELDDFDKLLNKVHLIDPELEFKQKIKSRKKAKRNEYKN